MPVMDLKELEDRYSIVQYFVDNQDELCRLQTMIGDIGDLERIISRAAAGKIMPREVMQLRRGLSQTDPIMKLCNGKGVQALDDMIANMGDCAELLDYLGKTMHPETASQLGKGDVIASGVNEELDELRRIAEEQDRPVSVINGMERSMRAYEEDDDSVTFIQYQAGSMGLNLQKADKIVYFSLPERSELFEQSKKRIHRIGQKNACTYFIMMSASSIDELIYRALEQKKDYTDELFREQYIGKEEN
jgi:DNA mismatch repair ATPase MutS